MKTQRFGWGINYIILYYRKYKWDQRRDVDKEYVKVFQNMLHNTNKIFGSSITKVTNTSINNVIY